MQKTTLLFLRNLKDQFLLFSLVLKYQPESGSYCYMKLLDFLKDLYLARLHDANYNEIWKPDSGCPGEGGGKNCPTVIFFELTQKRQHLGPKYFLYFIRPRMLDNLALQYSWLDTHCKSKNRSKV